MCARARPACGAAWSQRLPLSRACAFNSEPGIAPIAPLRCSPLHHTHSAPSPREHTRRMQCPVGIPARQAPSWDIARGLCPSRACAAPRAAARRPARVSGARRCPPQRARAPCRWVCVQNPFRGPGPRPCWTSETAEDRARVPPQERWRPETRRQEQRLGCWAYLLPLWPLWPGYRGLMKRRRVPGRWACRTRSRGDRSAGTLPGPPAPGPPFPAGAQRGLPAGQTEPRFAAVTSRCRRRPRRARRGLLRL
mmetsp:Transcript_19633/g.75349  ORF Transcript_19633/g.75349 Transcript_19633/m.75349 type:complete len:251 (+) Transcript_19633:1382-2134(+)